MFHVEHRCRLPFSLEMFHVEHSTVYRRQPSTESPSP